MLFSLHLHGLVCTQVQSPDVSISLIIDFIHWLAITDQLKSHKRPPIPVWPFCRHIIERTVLSGADLRKTEMLSFIQSIHDVYHSPSCRYEHSCILHCGSFSRVSQLVLNALWAYNGNVLFIFASFMEGCPSA